MQPVTYLRSACLVLGLLGGRLEAADPEGIRPAAADGRPLNLDFETGTLQDWTATGNAFQKQPVRGDTVKARRGDMTSAHQGEYWIGTYEFGGDDLTGTLTSARFRITQPWATFLIAGGPYAKTKVELLVGEPGKEKAVVVASGHETEDLETVVADLRPHLGKEMFIRITDEQKGHWGHINFDCFRFFAAEPKPARLARNPAREPPPPLDDVKFAGLSGEAAAREMTLPPGFKATLFAGEPDVVQPIAFCLDDRGRVWVAEGMTYPRRAPEGQGRDRILVFEDTDGDGRFDRRTVFMEKLNLVSGLEVGFGGVWIGAAPYLLFVPVEDWDHPKPSGQPQVLLDGWDFKRDTHETLNTFTWGPDGWLYGCHGVFCPSLVGKPGAPQSERQWVDAAVWRYHPTRHQFEVFAEGTSNPWGIDFDERGQCFIEACVVPHFWHVIQGARYLRQGGEHYCINLAETARNERHRDPKSRKPIFPYVYADIPSHGDHVHYAGSKGPHAGNGRSDAAGGGHAHAGLLIYQGDSWPAPYRGNLFMNNIHGQRINMDIPVPQGSGFVGRHGADFILFNDRWSQVLNLLSDQNGSVYLIDWYDKNQCHHNDVNGHDRSNGRIFKVVYGETPWTPVNLAQRSDAELVQLLQHPNAWHARHARRLLQERGPNPSVHAALARSLADASASAVAKLRALWALHATGGLTEALARPQLHAHDEFIRGWTVQLLTENPQLSPAVLTDLATLSTQDPSPVVRRYLASACQRLDVPQRLPILVGLLGHAEDASDHNLPLLYWYATEAVAAADQAQAIPLLSKTRLPRVRELMARRLIAGSFDPAQPAANALPALVQLLGSSNDPQFQIDLLRGISAGLTGRRAVKMPDGWEAVAAKLADSPDPRIRAMAEALSVTFGSPRAFARLRQSLQDAQADPKQRASALETLLAAHDSFLPGILRRLLDDLTLRGEALRGLAAFDDPATPEAILQAYPSLNSLEKKDALNTLVARAASARALLAAVGRQTVPASDLSADLVRALRGFKDPALNEQVTRLWGSVRETQAEQLQTIARYKKLIQTAPPGEPRRGQAVFARTCQQCHTLFGTGGKVGPDITGSNRGDLDYLLQNVIDPNAVIPNEYRSWNLETKDDRAITGIVTRQDDTSVTIVTVNETLVIPRAEVSSLKQGELSMMPEGLLQPLSEQEIKDLVAYLRLPSALPSSP